MGTLMLGISGGYFLGTGLVYLLSKLKQAKSNRIADTLILSITITGVFLKAYMLAEDRYNEKVYR